MSPIFFFFKKFFLSYKIHIAGSSTPGNSENVACFIFYDEN